MLHSTACKIPVSLLFLNWIRNEINFLSYVWINVGNISQEISSDTSMTQWVNEPQTCVFSIKLEQKLS